MNARQFTLRLQGQNLQEENQLMVTREFVKTEEAARERAVAEAIAQRNSPNHKEVEVGFGRAKVGQAEATVGFM